MALTLEGASDDLIELEGDIREEFAATSGTLVFSNGVVAHIRFGSAWRINLLRSQGSYSLSHNDEGDESLTIHDEVFWVVFTPGFQRDLQFVNKES